MERWMTFSLPSSKKSNWTRCFKCTKIFAPGKRRVKIPDIQIQFSRCFFHHIDTFGIVLCHCKWLFLLKSNLAFKLFFYLTKLRSEERRVGQECRSRCCRNDVK